MTTSTTSTDTQAQTSVTDTAADGHVLVKIVTNTGEERLSVPAEVGSNDDLLRAVLTEHGVSSAARAKIDREDNGTITLTKQADSNG